MKEKSLYLQIKEKALPLMTAYQTDLTKHDRNYFRKHDKTPFIHWTRKMGTHILELPGLNFYPPPGKQVPYLFGKADRNHLLNECISVSQYFVHEKCAKLVLYFDGRTLKEITAEKAVEISTDYVNKIERQWKAAT